MGSTEQKKQNIINLLKAIDCGYTATETECNWLSTITSLDLRHSNIGVLPKSIGLLKNLQVLDLRSSHTAVLPDTIGNLSKLQSLRLNANPISTLPNTIGQLTNLHSLFLSSTDITILPESIGNLKRLHSLYLFDSKLKQLPSSIGRLEELEELDLGNTKIVNLPEEIGQLTKLQSLELRDTPISGLPTQAGDLKNLKSLNLRGTRIKNIPDSVNFLTKMQVLLIGNTSISELPTWIGRLPFLRFLDLSNLSISEIPESLGCRKLPFFEANRIEYSNIGINLSGTTISLQNKAIFLETPELISSLYHSSELTTLSECRVIFLGDGATGKSYTICRFREDGKKENPDNPYYTKETPGVEILDYPKHPIDEGLIIHFWDFGGQQLLHSMHRCFLTDDSCYVVMVKTRETKANERARYWLRNVTAFAPKSPIILFVNCWDNDDGKRTIDEPILKKEYPNIHKVIYCSAKQAEAALFKNAVMEPILEMASTSTGRIKQIPKQWMEVRRAIEDASQKHYYLTKQQYHRLCSQNGIIDEQAPELLSFFNSLGVCFSYHCDKENVELSDYKLLSPIWLTNGLYAIIEEGKAYSKQDGKITRNGIGQMLCNSAPDKVGNKEYRRTVADLVYKDYECPFIIDIAIAFELCYQIDKDTLFFPALCTNNTPKSAMIAPPDYPVHIEYCFEYEFLPDSVIHKLMIRCFQRGYTIDECWLQGIELRYLNYHKIIVSMKDDRYLRINIYSKEDRPAWEFFPKLRDEIVDLSWGMNLTCREFIVDGNDKFALAKLILLYNEGVEIERGDITFRKFVVSELMGRLFDSWSISEMEYHDGKILIKPYLYHPASSKNPALRRAIWEVYGKKCQYCNLPIPYKELEVDHILAKHHVGVKDNQLSLYLAELEKNHQFSIDIPDYVENYFPACSDCNRKKSNELRSMVTLREYHAIALKHTRKVLDLMRKYEIEMRKEPVY